MFVLVVTSQSMVSGLSGPVGRRAPCHVTVVSAAASAPVTTRLPATVEQTARDQPHRLTTATLSHVLVSRLLSVEKFFLLYKAVVIFSSNFS